MHNVQQLEGLAVSSEEDIVNVRQRVRAHAVELGLGLVDQTKLVTAASELVRNMYVHGGGGLVTIDKVESPDRAGLRVTFEDRGPGIPDIDLAMQDGYSTANSMGMGLPGAKRLVHEFAIESKVNEGTRVQIVRWR